MTTLEFHSPDQAARLGLEWDDVYLSPAYGRAVEASDGAQWELAVWRPGPIVYPYLRRPLDAALLPDAFDVVSPYGYAGAWAAPGVGPAQWRAFRRAWREAIVARGAVAEFVRAGGFVSGYEAMLEADPALELLRETTTVAIDVARSFENAWAAAEGRARTKTRKAKKRGYTWSCRPCTLADVGPESSFRALYEGTMRRVEARPYYLFPTAYYEALAALGPRLLLIEVRHPDKGLGVSALAFDWAPKLHLHLVGNHSWALREGAGNLLYHGLVEWACEQGRFSRLHVGGGLSHEDRLFYFKRGFGGHAIPFVTASAILDPARYDAAVERHAQQLGCAPAGLRRSAYFPSYRASAPEPEPALEAAS